MATGSENNAKNATKNGEQQKKHCQNREKEKKTARRVCLYQKTKKIYIWAATREKGPLRHFGRFEICTDKTLTED